MDAQVANLRMREFFWGHSMGIASFALAGAFWLILAATSRSATWTSADRLPRHVSWAAMSGWGAVIVGPTLLVLAGAVRVRRKATGFSRHDLRRPELADGVRARARVWYRASIAQFVGCGLSAWLGTQFHREDLIWPGIALVVSLHFAPFGRPYSVMSVAGSLVAAAALLLPLSLLPPASRLVFIGVGMGLINWTTAAYVILRADRLARAHAEST